MARLLPLVAEDPRARDLGDGDLGLAGAVGAHQADVLARLQRPLRQQDRLPRRHGHDHRSGERLGLARSRADPELGRDGTRPLPVDVPEQDVAAPLLEARRGRAAVDARADHRCRTGAAERLGRDRSGGAGPQRRHRAGVQHGLDDAGLGVREDDETAHGREAPSRVARERRDPLQQRVAAAERRHGAEVARRVVGDVELRLHRPLAARVGDERVAHRVVGATGRHRRLDVAGREERDRHRYSPFSAAATSSSACFASAKSIEVFGS